MKQLISLICLLLITIPSYAAWVWIYDSPTDTVTRTQTVEVEQEEVYPRQRLMDEVTVLADKRALVEADDIANEALITRLKAGLVKAETAGMDITDIKAYMESLGIDTSGM